MADVFKEYRGRVFPDMVARAWSPDGHFFDVDIPTKQRVMHVVMRGETFRATFELSTTPIPWPTDEEITVMAAAEEERRLAPIRFAEQREREYQENVERRRCIREESERAASERMRLAARAKEERQRNEASASAPTERSQLPTETRAEAIRASRKYAAKREERHKIVAKAEARRQELAPRRWKHGEHPWIAPQYAPTSQPTPFPADYFRSCTLEWIGNLWIGDDYALHLRDEDTDALSLFGHR